MKMMEYACSATVMSDRFYLSQCTRAGKVEREGKWYCRQHDPVAVAERRAKAQAKWEAEWAAKTAGWKETERLRRLSATALEALKAIAAGHNDPRTLAQEVLAEHGEAP